VAKQFLNSLDAFTLLTQETRQRVPERMPRYPLRYARLDRGRLDVILQG
jgi:hypothetical protein